MELHVKRTKLFSSISHSVGEEWHLSPSVFPSRLGSFSSKPNFQTPAILIPTEGGLVPHLTMDIWEEPNQFNPVFLSIPFSQVSVFSDANQDIHTCLNQLPEQVFILLRAMPFPAQNDAAIARFNANLFTLSNSDPITVYTGSNRNTLAVKRTHEQVVSSSRALYTIVGRDLISARKCLDNRPVVGGQENLPAGYFLSVSYSIALELVKELPAHGLRVVDCGVVTPTQVLELIHAGFDLVETAYAQYLSKLGFASLYALESGDGNQGDKLDVRDPTLMVDQTPLVANCTCFTCRNHTKAYLRHLLEIKEMLGETLLFAHNLHRLLRLVEHARRQIALGTFPVWFAWWKKQLVVG